MRMRRPARYPDIEVWDGDAPLRWRIYIQMDGEPLDLTHAELSAPVIDNGEEVGELAIDLSEAAAGILYLTLTEELYNAVGAYSQWRLREDVLLRMLLLRGRFVRKDHRPSEGNVPPSPHLAVDDVTINVADQLILEVHSGNPLTPAQREALGAFPGLQPAIELLDSELDDLRELLDHVLYVPDPVMPTVQDIVLAPKAMLVQVRDELTTAQESLATAQAEFALTQADLISLTNSLQAENEELQLGQQQLTETNQRHTQRTRFRDAYRGAFHLMPFEPLPENITDYQPGHTAIHNATNARVNEHSEAIDGLVERVEDLQEGKLSPAQREAVNSIPELAEDVDGLTSRVTDVEGGVEDLNSILPDPISVPDYSATLDAIKTQDVYDLWDALLLAHPDKLVSSNLGADQSGNYQLRKIVFNAGPFSPKKSKILITANLHRNEPNGDAKAPAVLVYELIKALCENPDSNRALQNFFYAYTIEIVPVANPWGFDNDKRTNSRNADLNRNFDTNNCASNGSSDPAHYQYRGPSPASELETQIFQNLIKSSGYDLVVDFHCWGFKGAYNPDRLIYYPISSSGDPAGDAARVSFDYLARKYGVAVTKDPTSGGLKGFAHQSDMPAFVLEFEPFAAGETPYSTKMMTKHLEVLVNYLLAFRSLYGERYPKTKVRYIYRNGSVVFPDSEYAEWTQAKRSTYIGSPGIAIFEGHILVGATVAEPGGFFVCPLLGQTGEAITYETPPVIEWESQSQAGYRVALPFSAMIPVVAGKNLDYGLQVRVSAASGPMTVYKLRGILRIEPIDNLNYQLVKVS